MNITIIYLFVFNIIIEKGPWIVGDEIQGSYFIQALIHVFKNMAYDKTFMEMMKEVTK